ncbi:hypothetical protein DFH11DRAFT_609900 [Phellopilus nigrolimitatus]|nr:hypothetical protein DFH11DRAFT_609900 [Phellopilus nigrolimitatus]
MDSCSTEVVAHILEFACEGPDGGRTARRLGLVSKYLRELAEPFEFRALEVTGTAMIENAVDRLQNADAYFKARGRANLGVRHLILCDYTREHARMMGTSIAEGLRFEHTSVGQDIAKEYIINKHRFWEPAAHILALAAPSLLSLSILAFHSLEADREGRFSSNSLYGNGTSGIMGALSGVHFSLLTDLTIKHDLRLGFNAYLRDTWVPPTMPSLRRLSVISDWYTSFYNDLASVCPILLDMHAKYPLLEHLFLRDNQFGGDIERLVAVLCGRMRHDPESHETPSSAEHLMFGTLPGNLRSVTLKFGPMPAEYTATTLRFSNSQGGFDFVEDGTPLSMRKQFERLKSALEAHPIDGLSLIPPDATFNLQGEGEFDGLHDEWLKRQ